eukprot:TRINITY_DN3432_c0_g3_i1.p1 TRINITY_DN3432_c0_g3~~TRINITY_DN3432_c0_g3_i1.p1  ORF type:complete len:515 (-),score=179.59 TRINITY_DN3432_c0_g3_i1:161-1705(-)
MESPEEKDPEITHLIDEAEKVKVIQMNDEGVKQLLANLTQKYKRNMDLRLKFQANPEKFAESEADLNAELKNTQMVTAYPDLLLSFVGYRGVDLFMDILGHENTDIVIGVVSILKELSEGDIILAAKDNIQFIEYLISKEVPKLLIDTLERLDLKRDEDLEGVYNVLCTLENIADCKPEMCDYYFTQDKLMAWLFKYITSEDERELNDAKICSCEVLSIIIEHSKDAKESLGQSKSLLEILKEVHRRCTGEYESSEEYINDLFNIICCCLLSNEGKETFRKYEGIELMLKLMKCGLKVRRCALKVLDFALSNTPVSCKEFVNVLGLPFLFAIFMKRGYRRSGKLRVSEAELRKDEEYAVSLVWYLLKYCKGVDHDRVIYKFKENSCDKVQRLADMYEEYVDAYNKYVDIVSGVEDEKERESIYIEETNNGLYTFQVISVVIGMLLLEKDPQILEALSDHIANKKIRLDGVIKGIKEYLAHTENKEGSREYEILKEMLETLEKDLSKKKTESVPG